MKKRRIFYLLLSFCFLIAAACPASAASSSDLWVSNGCHSVDAAFSLSDSEKLTETAKAAIIYELGSDTMIYGYNLDEKIYPSSMVKLMTALVALERGELTDRVTVTKRALSYLAPGSVSLGLVAGEELTLEHLLYCMMVASANDATVAVAEHIGGSQDIFIAMMNDKAEELGCTGTHFSNSHGLHDEETYTTARDICRIMDYALENETFRAMFTAESYKVPATNKAEERTVWTTNLMMSTHTNRNHYDSRVTGGKTGATDEAGRCLVATAEGNGMEILTIVMGAKPIYSQDGLSVEYYGSFEETHELINFAMKNYEYRQIFFDGQAVTQLPVENGANSVVVGPAAGASTVLPVGLEAKSLNWVFENSGTVTAPLEKGQRVTGVQVWFGTKCIAQTDLMAMHGVAAWQPMQDQNVLKGNDGFDAWTVILVVLGVFLAAGALAAVVLVMPRVIRRTRRNRRHRQRRNNRQRSR